MKIKDIFWTYPAETESGKTLIITGRDGLDEARLGGKYTFRVTVSLRYNPIPNGMPDAEAAENLEKITDALLSETKKDPAAIITGIYTGDSLRDWVFYTRSLHIFRNIFNRALVDLPEFPFEISAAEDPDWEEYLDMKSQTYIPDEE